MATLSTTLPKMLGTAALLALAGAGCFSPDTVKNGDPTHTDPGGLVADPDALTPPDATTTGPQTMTLLYGISSQACLTAVDAATVLFTQCNGNPNQVWSFQNGQFVSSNGSCLNANSSAPLEGTPVTLASCDSTYQLARQQWEYQAGEIVLNNTSLCILPQQGNPSPAVYKCGPTAQSNDQMWVLGHADGSGVYGTSWTPVGQVSPCVTADQNSGQLTLQTCANSARQAWAPAAYNMIAMGAGLCVALDPDAGAAGGAALLASCDTSTSQRWAFDAGQMQLQGTSTCLGVDAFTAGSILHGVPCASGGNTSQWALGLH